MLELRRRAARSGSRPSPYHFRDRQGTEVDVVLQGRDGRVAGIEVKPSRSVRAAASSSFTGPSNLAAHLLCPDTGSLYRYLTDGIGSLPGVHQVETAPVVRSIKRGG